VNERNPPSIFIKNRINQLLENAYNTFPVLNKIIWMTMLSAKGVVDMRLQLRWTGERVLQ
jgi:hypothetical protein